MFYSKDLKENPYDICFGSRVLTWQTEMKFGQNRYWGTD
uniref:Uncharacterized protein n=1 Tax=Anguilla anguilla TaxID=7936 RepID=A0A0E9R4R1_ANGAN